MTSYRHFTSEALVPAKNEPESLLPRFGEKCFVSNLAMNKVYIRLISETTVSMIRWQ